MNISIQYTGDSIKCSKTRKRSISVITGMEEKNFHLPHMIRLSTFKKIKENLQIFNRQVPGRLLDTRSIHKNSIPTYEK